MKRFDNLRGHPLLGLVLLSIVLTGCPPPVEDDPNQNNTVTDIEGNIYKTVTIGTQVWMAENLKTTKYNDGSVIPIVTDNTAWTKLTTPAYCWYDNDVGNKSIYGALYNWYTVNTNKLCPAGWHVPTDEQWSTLINGLGGENNAGGKLKEVGTSHWFAPNPNATNVTGFTGIPGGYRNDFSTTFFQIAYTAYFWSSTELVMYSSEAWYRTLVHSSDFVGRTSGNNSKIYGLSVRCLKD